MKTSLPQPIPTSVLWALAGINAALMLQGENGNRRESQSSILAALIELRAETIRELAQDKVKAGEE